MQSKAPSERTAIIANLREFKIHEQTCTECISFADDDASPPQNFSVGRPAERRALNGQTAFTFYSFVLGFAVPLLLILTFYILVIVKLQTVGPKNKSKERRKSHRKVTRLVLTVITVYILCWLPYWITQLSLIFTPPGEVQVRSISTFPPPPSDFWKPRELRFSPLQQANQMVR